MRTVLRLLAMESALFGFAASSFAQAAENDVQIQEFPNGQITITSTNVPPPRQISVAPAALAPTSAFALLNIERVQQDLELADYQKQQIRELRQRTKESRQELLADIPNPALIRPAIDALRHEEERAIKEILLPRQLKRLGQLQLHMSMRNQGTLALMRNEFDDALGLTPEQKQKLAKKQEEAKKELKRRVEEIRNQLNQEIRAEVLTLKQRQTLKQLIGEPLEILEE